SPVTNLCDRAKPPRLYLCGLTGAETRKCAVDHIFIVKSRISPQLGPFGFAEEDILSAQQMGLLLVLYIGVNLVSGQNANAAPDTNPIGKVLIATGTVRIDHPGAV